LTETQTKNLEADFSDSTKPTRHFADEMKADKTKSGELENLLAKSQTQTKLEKTPPLKNGFEFLSQSQKQTL